MQKAVKNLVILFFVTIILTAQLVSTAYAEMGTRSRKEDNTEMYTLLSSCDVSLMHETNEEFKKHNSELETLTLSITENCPTDYDKIKAIYYWVANNIYYDQEYYLSTHMNGTISKNPDDVYEKRATTCSGYANLCVKMLDIINIPNTKVEVYSSASKDAPLVDEFTRTHALNAAYDGQRWILFDTNAGSDNEFLTDGTYSYGGADYGSFDYSLEKLSEKRRILCYSNELKLQDGNTYQPTVTKDEIVMNVIKEYEIIYYLNNGKNDISNPSNYNMNEEVSFKQPTRKGYLFMGWYMDKDFKNEIKIISNGTTQNYNLYAMWEKVRVNQVIINSVVNRTSHKLKITYNKINGANGYEIMYSSSNKFTTKTSNIVITENISYTLAEPTKFKTYYIKVRAYKLDSAGDKVYGKYSAVKNVKMS